MGEVIGPNHRQAPNWTYVIHHPQPQNIPEGFKLHLAPPEPEALSKVPELSCKASAEDRIGTMALHPDLITMVELDMGLDPSNPNILDERMDILEGLGLNGVRADLQTWYKLSADDAEAAEEMCRERVRTEREVELGLKFRWLEP